MTESEKKPPAQAVASVDSGLGVEALKESYSGVRAHLNKAGTGLGAIATALLAGLGWTQLHELFPLPETAPALGWIAAGAAFSVIVCVALLVLRIFAAQRRILVSSLLTRASKQRGMTDEERDAAADVLDRHAYEEGARNLHALELRALRLDRLARNEESSARKKRFVDEADRLHEVVRIASFRAVGQVLERRQEHIFGGSRTKLLVIVAGLGIVTLWAAADYSAGERDLIDLRSKCVAAVKKGAVTACEAVVAKPTPAEKKKAAADDAAALRKADAEKLTAATKLAEARKRLGASVGSDVQRAQDCIEVVGADLGKRSATVQNAAFRACLTSG